MIGSTLTVRPVWLLAVIWRAATIATPPARLVRVQDPFGNLLDRARGSILLGMSQIMEVGEV